MDRDSEDRDSGPGGDIAEDGCGAGPGDVPSEKEGKHLAPSPRSVLYRRSRGVVHAGADKRTRAVRRFNARLAQMDRARAAMVLSPYH